MKIVVTKLLGDAAVNIFNKQGELIHTEGFFGKTNSAYIRSIPVDPVEFGYSTSVFDKVFEYHVGN